MICHGGDCKRISGRRWCKCGASGVWGQDSEFESPKVVLCEHCPKSVVKHTAQEDLWHLVLFLLLPLCSPSLGGGDIDVSCMAGHPIVIYSQYFDHLGVSTVTTDYHQNKLLWPKLKAALFYGYKHLKGKLTDTYPFSKIALVVFLLKTLTSVMGLFTGFVVKSCWALIKFKQ